MKDLITRNVIFRPIIILTLIAFTSLSIFPSQALAQGTLLGLPQPGAMVPLSPSFTPVLLKGLQVYPNNPLRFDFIVDTGDTGFEGRAFQDEAQKIIKYFLASLTTPEDEFWVNLSPYEKDRIIAESLGQTEMGRDLLAQDYMLKQLTATLVDPNSDLGKKFWERVYKKAYELYGTTQIPANTFNKIWIVPDEAVVYEHETYAFVGERHLKVMLEEDYLAMEQSAIRKDNSQSEEAKKIAAASSGVVREVLLPEIEKEVNNGKIFANLRQIFDAMILATWYKKTLKESLLGQVYADQNKIKGIDLADKTIKDQIYDQYLASFKKGIFDLIKVEKDPVSGKNIPRKYFSGGVSSGVIKIDKLRTLPLRLGKKVIDFFSLKRKTMRTVTTDLAQAGASPMLSVDHEAQAPDLERGMPEDFNYDSVELRNGAKLPTELKAEAERALRRLQDYKNHLPDQEMFKALVNSVRSGQNMVGKAKDFWFGQELSSGDGEVEDFIADIIMSAVVGEGDNMGFRSLYIDQEALDALGAVIKSLREKRKSLQNRSVEESGAAVNTEEYDKALEASIKRAQDFQKELEGVEGEIPLKEKRFYQNLKSDMQRDIANYESLLKSLRQSQHLRAIEEKARRQIQVIKEEAQKGEEVLEKFRSSGTVNKDEVLAAEQVFRGALKRINDVLNEMDSDRSPKDWSYMEFYGELVEYRDDLLASISAINVLKDLFETDEGITSEITKKDILTASESRTVIGSAITLEEAKDRMEEIFKEDYPSLAVEIQGKERTAGEIFEERKSSFTTEESLAIFILEIKKKISEKLFSSEKNEEANNLGFVVRLLNDLQEKLIGQRIPGRQWQTVTLNGGGEVAWTDLALAVSLFKSMKGWDERHKGDPGRKNLSGAFENLWNHVKKGESLAQENLKHLKESFVLDGQGEVKRFYRDIIKASVSTDQMEMIDLVDLSKMGAAFLVDVINLVKNHNDFKSKITSIVIEHEEWGPLDFSIEDLEGLGNTDIFRTGIKRIFFNLQDKQDKALLQQNLGALVFEMKPGTRVYIGVYFSPGPDVPQSVGQDYVQKAYAAMRGAAGSAIIALDEAKNELEGILKEYSSFFVREDGKELLEIFQEKKESFTLESLKSFIEEDVSNAWSDSWLEEELESKGEPSETMDNINFAKFLVERLKSNITKAYDSGVLAGDNTKNIPGTTDSGVLAGDNTKNIPGITDRSSWRRGDGIDLLQVKNTGLTKGGIDLNAANMNLQIKRDGSGMPLPLAQQPAEFRNIEGLTPLIINVVPFNPAAILSQIEGEAGAAISG